MFAVLSPLRKALRPAAGLVTALALSACDPSAIGGLGVGGGNSGPKIDPNKPIQVALLLPKSDAQAASVAKSLEQAARMAVEELSGAKIELKTYDTSGAASTAAAQAQRAVDEGAKIILGPLRADAVNGAGLAVADEGINVLGFSNNPSIAGGNVFLLGPTFNNTADRLMAHARKNGKKSIVIIYSDDISGQFGRSAIELAASKNGIRVVSSEGYSLSVEGVTATAKAAAAAVAAGDADSIFITTEANNAAMPMLLNQLPANGVAPDQVQYVGLTRFDIRPDLFSLPGAEGVWFALPDQSSQTAFANRFAAKYGEAPHPLAGLAYDGITAIATLAQQGRGDALTAKALTRGTGFNGTGGVFRLTADGTNQRALSVATIKDNQMVILDPAPKSFSGAGF